jgi:hypothetical protein
MDGLMKVLTPKNRLTLEDFEVGLNAMFDVIQERDREARERGESRAVLPSTFASFDGSGRMKEIYDVILKLVDHDAAENMARAIQVINLAVWILAEKSDAEGFLFRMEGKVGGMTENRLIFW